MAEAVWLRLGVAAYLVATLVALPGLRRGRHAATLGHLGVGTGVLALALSLGLRWVEAGQGPFLTLYEVVASNLFSVGLVYGFARRQSPEVRDGALPVLVVLSVLGVWAVTLPREIVPLPPTFDSPWLWLHVLTGKLFLGTCLIAASLGLGEVCGPADARRRSAMWRFGGLALACDAGMLLAGSLWARSAWGRYWHWDPVETWALVTFLALAALMHARTALRSRPSVAGALMGGIFVLALLTFLGVPFFSHAPHKGVF
ncbi:MAG: cytochrome c biogenesis protein CcsA [Burkholderiales bacterium]